MIYSTKGIVVNYIKYKETSIIVRIYTKSFGLRSYIVNSVRSKKSKGKMALYQPLTILDLVVYENNSKSLQRISEAKCFYPYKEIPFEIRKTSIALFIAELLSKTLRHSEDPDELTYQFIESSLIHFDSMGSHIGHFHLQFMLRLTTFLGFRPYDIDELLGQIEDLTSYSAEDLRLFDELNHSPYDSSLSLTIPQRNTFLKAIINYYQLHEEHIGGFKSLPVLKEVFHT
ncbi:DNA repair protein RecO [Cyclobacteriaceae bacterium]|nr:DNA repair protein RecO [Cyclobacteriaceae bacterium]